MKKNLAYTNPKKAMSEPYYLLKFSICGEYCYTILTRKSVLDNHREYPNQKRRYVSQIIRFKGKSTAAYTEVREDTFDPQNLY